MHFLWFNHEFKNTIKMDDAVYMLSGILCLLTLRNLFRQFNFSGEYGEDFKRRERIKVVIL